MITALIHNFPAYKIEANLQLHRKCPKCGRDRCEHIKLLLGFQKNDFKQRKKQILNDLFSALMLNDILYVFSTDAFWLIRLFSLEELRILIQSETIVIIQSTTTNSFIHSYKEKHGFNNANYSKREDFISSFEEHLIKAYDKKLTQPCNDILAILESNPKIIDGKILNTEIRNELKADINNKAIRSAKKIRTRKLDDLKYADALDILSIAYDNRALIISSEINVNNIVLNSSSKELINHKMTSIYQKELNKQTKSVDVFQNIMLKKEIPNLADLYLEGILSLEDILSIRNNFNGKVFRKWFESKDYNQEETEKVLINGVKSSAVANFLSKIKWAIAPLVGFTTIPSLGAAAAYANSKVLNRILEGWHPNLFLDKKLKQTVDERRLEHRAKHTNEIIKSRHQKVDRNSLCPCGSTKKYKRCCGKIKV